MEEKHSGGTVAVTGGDERPDDQSQEKTTLGGEYNSGVTSRDPETKERIEKQATILDTQPQNGNDEPAYGTTPDSQPQGGGSNATSLNGPAADEGKHYGDSGENPVYRDAASGASLANDSRDDDELKKDSQLYSAPTNESGAAEIVHSRTDNGDTEQEQKTTIDPPHREA